jgi:hypothetical protein
MFLEGSPTKHFISFTVRQAIILRRFPCNPITGKDDCAIMRNSDFDVGACLTCHQDIQEPRSKCETASLTSRIYSTADARQGETYVTMALARVHIIPGVERPQCPTWHSRLHNGITDSKNKTLSIRLESRISGFQHARKSRGGRRRMTWEELGAELRQMGVVGQGKDTYETKQV